MSWNAPIDARQQVRRGRQLAAEKRKCAASGQTWRSYVKEHLGLSRERADELIRIGAGLLSVEASREGKKDRQRASRARHGRPRLKVQLLKQAARSNDTCAGLRRRISKLHATQVTPAEIGEMREAVLQAAASWQGVLREVDALDPVGRPPVPAMHEAVG